MSNEWVRLWHDMPNDPKWRTIARLSKQSIGDVMAVYLHLLVNASANATERGRTQAIAAEHIASALDLDDAQVEAILAQMEDRVIKNSTLTGWVKRNPKREDGSAERAKTWRNAQKENKLDEKTEIPNETKQERTQPNADERNRPPDKDTEKDKDIKKTKAKKDLVYSPQFLRLWEYWPKKIEKPDAAKMFELMIGDNTELLETAIGAVLRQLQERNDRKNLGLLVPEWRSLERWLKARKWEDEVMTETQLREQRTSPKSQGFNQPTIDLAAESRRLANEKARRDSDEVQKRDEDIAAKKREDQYQRWQSTYPDLSVILERKFSSGGGRANWIVACQQRDDQQQNMAKTA